MTRADTIEIAETASGKTHRDENFPVASVLIAPPFRAPILAFYNFVRAADDISDHASLAPQEKLALLDRLEAALLRRGPDEEPARALRDVTQLRYRDLDDLIDYCRYSAMPVGRFVLDVHGEDAAVTWTTNDALCAALQVINHLQDCGKDYRNLNRVYLPQDTLAASGASVEMLGEEKAPPPLRAALRALTQHTDELLKEARPFAGRIQNTRLAMEVGAIQSLAEKLTDRLLVADPLSEKVHAGKAAFLLASAQGAAGVLLRRLLRGKPRGLA
jgi:hydroxysqualene synthase